MDSQDPAEAPIEAFITDLAGLDVRLWLDGDQLRCSAPNDVLTPELQTKLSDRKNDLRAFLQRAQKVDVFDLAPAPRDGAIPLSHSQERIWTLSEMRPGTSVYNKIAAYRLVGTLDFDALEHSLSELNRRHEILRTCFPADGGRPHQVIGAPAAMVLPYEDVVWDMRKDTPEERDARVRQYLFSLAEMPFDLHQGPLWRSHLVRVSDGDHMLSFTMHHIIFDGFSKDVFLRELSEIYVALSSGKDPALADLPVQFADYAIWQRNQSLEEAASREFAYWKEHLDDSVTPLRLPIDHPRSNVTSKSGRCKSFELPDATAQNVRSLSKSSKVSLFVTLLAAYAVTLNRYTGQTDMLICSPMASRDRADLEGLIGYFNNVVALRIDLSGNPSVRELLNRTRQEVIGAHDNQNLPLQRLAELPSLARVPLNRGMLCYQDVTSRTLELPGIETIPIDLRVGEADFEFAIYLEGTSQGRLSGLVDYNAGLIDADTIHAVLENFYSILDRMALNPDQRLSEFEKLARELEDIVLVLESHPKIDQAVVVDLPNKSGIAAYVILNEFDVPDLDEVREYLNDKFPAFMVPDVLIPLDVFPLLPDGAVDVHALPPAKAARPTDYVAPRTDLEKQIAGVWKKALWLQDDVGIEDDFSDLGGHSLLMVEIVLMLETALGQSLPARAVAGLSTVSRMAEMIEADDSGHEAVAGMLKQSKLPQEIYKGLLTYTSTWKGQRLTPDSVIVGLNLKGNRQPLYWCLQREGELVQFAKYLGTDQPVYGMRSGNRIMVKAQANIDALAAYYVDEILAIQPEGPFLIGGNCQAAQIAFQVAKGLQNRGHEVNALIMLERFEAFHYSGRVTMLFGAESDRNPRQRFKTPEFAWQKYYTGPLNVEAVTGRHAQFFLEPNVQVLTDAVRRSIDAAVAGGPANVSEHVKDAFQYLTHSAYRAELSASGPDVIAPGATFKFQVSVRNASSQSWKPGHISGLMLGNRWINQKGQTVNSTDGRTSLPKELKPGEETTLFLEAKAPTRSGHWTVELDMVDEGVTWFGDQGSKTTRFDIAVQGATGFAGKSVEKFLFVADSLRERLSKR